MNSLQILHCKDRVDFEIKTQTGRKLSFDSRCRLLPAWLPWVEQFWPPLHWSPSESYKAWALWCQCSIWDFRVSFSQQEPFLFQALSRVSYVDAITSGSSLGSVSVASVSTCLDYVHFHLMCLTDRTTLEFSLLPFPGRVRTGVLAFPRLTYWRFLRPCTNLWEVTYEIKEEQFSVHPPTHPTPIFHFLFHLLHGNQHLISPFPSFFPGGQALLTRSLQLEKAGVVALVRTLDIALAFMLQLLFLDYTASIYSIVGATLVLGCNVLVILNRAGFTQNKDGTDSHGKVPEERKSLMGTVKRQLYGKIINRSY